MNKKTILYGGVAMIVALVIAVCVSVFKFSGAQRELNEVKAANEQLQLSNEQLQLSNEFAAIDAEFQQRENDAIRLENDTILAKYTAAKAKVEELINELNNEKTKNQAQIKKLQDEINTLRGLLRHYVAQIDSLGKENAALRKENENLTGRNEQLSSRVAEVTRQNENLTEIKTLAEKLNVTGVQLTPLNKRGKKEKNVTKAKQLMVTFTISPNNTAPTGLKTIYLRLVGPEGSLLGQAGTFNFEGASLPFTEKKTVEYDGSEMSGIQIYWNVDVTLNPGDYTVELFADNFRLTSRHFTLKK